MAAIAAIELAEVADSLDEVEGAADAVILIRLAAGMLAGAAS